jgi:hypothetical protein
MAAQSRHLMRDSATQKWFGAGVVLALFLILAGSAFAYEAAHGLPLNNYTESSSRTYGLIFSLNHDINATEVRFSTNLTGIVNQCTFEERVTPYNYYSSYNISGNTAYFNPPLSLSTAYNYSITCEMISQPGLAMWGDFTPVSGDYINFDYGFNNGQSNTIFGTVESIAFDAEPILPTPTIEISNLRIEDMYVGEEPCTGTGLCGYVLRLDYNSTNTGDDVYTVCDLGDTVEFQFLEGVSDAAVDLNDSDGDMFAGGWFDFGTRNISVTCVYDDPGTPEGEFYSNQLNYTYFFGIPPCAPAWSCSSYGACGAGNTKPCLGVADSNLCNVSFSGNLSSYAGSCTYGGGSGGIPAQQAVIVPIAVISQPDSSTSTLGGVMTAIWKGVSSIWTWIVGLF